MLSSSISLRSLILPPLVSLFSLALLPPSARAEEKPSPAAAVKDPAPLAEIGKRKKGEDWPSFLGPRRDGKSRETGYRPTEKPKVLWRKRLGEGYAIGSTARGRYFQSYRLRDRMVLASFNAETGEELWKFEYPSDFSDRYGYNGGPRTSPVIDVDCDLVFFYGPEGMLYALRASTGEEVWKLDTAKKYGVIENFFGVGSTPLIDGDKLLVVVGGSPPGEASNYDFLSIKPNGTAVVAFDKRTGKEIYRTGDELASYASPLITTFNDRRVGLAFVRGGLYGFDPDTGATEFHFPWRAKILESVNAATPVVDGPRVLITETYGPGSALLDLSGLDPKVVWQDNPKVRHRALKAHWNTPILHEGYVYASSGRHTGDAELRCIKFDTGEVQWSIPELTRCSLLYVDGRFLCQCEDGRILVFAANPKKFDLICEIELDVPLRYPSWSAPILSRGLAYFRDEYNTICVELIPEKP
jgi:outer membrane protein assembly factor BamB